MRNRLQTHSHGLKGIVFKESVNSDRVPKNVVLAIGVRVEKQTHEPVLTCLQSCLLLPAGSIQLLQQLWHVREESRSECGSLCSLLL